MGYLKDKIEDVALKLGGVDKPTLPQKKTSKNTTYTGTDPNTGTMSWDVKQNKPAVKNKTTPTTRKKKKDDDEVALIPNKDGSYDIVKGERMNTILNYTTGEMGRTAAIGIGSILAIPITIVACGLILLFGFKFFIEFMIANQGNIQITFMTIMVSALQMLFVVFIIMLMVFIYRGYDDFVNRGKKWDVVQFALGLTVFLSLNFFIVSWATTSTWANVIYPTIQGQNHSADMYNSVKDALNEPVNNK